MSAVIRIFIFIFIFLSISGLRAQDFQQAFRTGNYRLFASSFNANVELNLVGNEGYYSKVQAEQILKDFINRHPPQNYIQRHAGLSRDGNQYQIGTLQTSVGKFRTYLFLQKIGEATFIKELRIEREN